ncbi:hypothetical protein M8818_000754 [Zalaria obscura]|uniref:Uncharacterized protein n=1 Tax=Zalaria obscura TaxID=2024903 RepID=A0ACC3SMN7_9PEZI
MARSHIGIALVAAGIALIATFTLIQQLGLPELNYWHWESITSSFGGDGVQQFLDDAAQTEWSTSTRTGDQYLLGVGKADITGPSVEINFMGYADPNQLGSGIRQRIYSRAFIIGDAEQDSDRFVYLVLDTQSGDTAIRHGILERLQDLGPEYAVYGQQNVAVTGTHSHSGPGAWLNYLLPQITSKGFNKQSYEAIVDGAVESIRQAHESLAPGHLSAGKIDIMDGNINRSPYAYLANPEQERRRYSHDVDKELTLLKFHRDEDEKDIGILTWFPVHGTSMLGNNTLVTGDNKGVAAYLFEQYAKSLENTSDKFVAGFSQANVGDTSPNVLGAFCESGPAEGEQCDFKDSLCAGKTGPCHGRGPHFGLNDAGTASAYEIGRRQFAGARELYESMAESGISIHGPTVRSLHTFVDFANRTFVLPNGTLARTCPAAMGYSFAAGTTDGPGAFDFKQNNPGDPKANPVWSVVRNQLHEPGPEQIACHGAKPILLDVGETKNPYLWTPNIVDLQFLRVGQLFIIVSPGEATTMAGRRWKEALASTAARILPGVDDGDNQPLVVLGGPANTYTHYIATEEEYSIQRYEGASTLYGPHTLNAYINLTLDYLPYLSQQSTTISPDAPPQHPHLPRLRAGPSPPIFVNDSLSFITPVIVDRPPFFKSFGDLHTDVHPRYLIANSPTITAEFVGANPRNNLRLGGTYAAVERFDAGTKKWVRVRDDADWSVVFEWKRTSTALGTSSVTVSWELGFEEERVEWLRGRWRLRYFGDAKALGGGVTEFEGVSGEFILA